MGARCLSSAHAHGARLYTRNAKDLIGIEHLIDIVAVRATPSSRFVWKGRTFSTGLWRSGFVELEQPAGAPPYDPTGTRPLLRDTDDGVLQHV